MARLLQLHNGDLFLKLRYVEEFPGCQHFIGDVSRVELEMQIRLVFSLKSNAPRVTERQCLIPKAVSFVLSRLVVCWRNGEVSVQIRSFATLLAN